MGFPTPGMIFSARSDEISNENFRLPEQIAMTEAKYEYFTNTPVQV
jgi:hypothetical protein